MNRFYRFEPPKEEDYLSEEDYQDAVNAWELPSMNMPRITLKW